MPAMFDLVESLSPRRRGELENIRRSVKQGVWDASIHTHFTFHGPQIADQLLTILASFAQRLPSKLNDVECFLLAAAACLYDIGMQARNLQSIGIADNNDISGRALEEIREQRARLTIEMIHQSTQPMLNYPSLGLSGQEYIPALIQICSVSDLNELPNVYDTDLIDGEQVRLRLIARLLLLADRFFVSSDRVNITRLSQLELISVDKRAQWWAYHYVRSVWIDAQDDIQIQMVIPREHENLQETLGKFISDLCRQVQQELRKVGIRVFPPDRPRTMIESAHLLNKLLLPSPLERYWRLGPTSTINQVTLFVDFEGLSIFLGRHGQFGRKLEEITRALLTAARVYGPVLRAKFYADWDRYTDEAKALNDLKSDPDYHFLEHVFYLIEDELVTANIARDAFDLAQQFGHNQCFIIMCSRPGLEEHIQKLQQFGQVIIWGAGRDAEKTYRVCANQFAAIDNLLGIPLREELSYQAEETLLQLIAIIIDNDLTLRRFETVSLNQMIQLLARSTIPTFRWSRWWINLAVNRCLIRRADLKLDRVLYRLDPQSPIVQKAIELKEQILVTLDTLTQQGRKTTVAHLERTLRTNSALSYDEGRHFWIDMLRHDGLIQEEPLTLDNDLPPITVNRNDPRVRPIIQGRQHLDHLIVTMANLLLENPTYRWLRPRQVKERLESRLGGSKVVQSTFNLAESTGIIRFVERESDKGRVFQIYFDNNHPRVIQSLSVRDRVICLTHDWLRMYQVITVDKLATLLATAIPDQNEAFRLRWITILQEEGILKSESSTDAAPPTYSLDESSVVVKSVLLPIYLKLLIYVVGHHEPSEQYPAPGAKRLVKQLAEQTKSESLAQAVLDLGKQQRMLFIRTIEDERFHSGRLSFVELNDNGKRLLNILNEQQAEVRKNIIYLLETQERNWFPFGALMDLMRSQMHFGALDAERHFWIQRMVEERILTRQTSKGSTGQVVYTLAV